MSTVNSDLTKQIIEHAGCLFDVVGVSQPTGAHSLIILGLESTPDRNLDEFGRLDGDFQIYGFGKHVKPGLDSLLNFIRGQGLSADPVGRYGYPLRGSINLKKEAIAAGLCRRGKSTIVLHPRYGTRLRFAVIRVKAIMEPTAGLYLPEEENPLCEGCSICVDACPVGALEPYCIPDTSICLSNSDNMTEEQGRLIPCDICLDLCPAGKSD